MQRIAITGAAGFVGPHVTRALREAGFAQAECLLVLEREIEAPTAAQNYACFKALR